MLSRTVTLRSMISAALREHCPDVRIQFFLTYFHTQAIYLSAARAYFTWAGNEVKYSKRLQRLALMTLLRLVSYPFVTAEGGISLSVIPS